MLKELATGKGDWEILQWIQANCTTPRQHWEIEAFSSFMERYAPDSDPETLAVFAGYFKNFPEGREDLKTWFEVLELDDYVSYGGNALCPELEKTDCWRRRLNLRVWRNCSGEDDASE
jgi:Domain of unknown function (DUF5069)